MKSRNPVLVNGLAASGMDVLDRGLQYGDGVFRTVKVVSGQARWWADQFRKLADDCLALAIPPPDKAVLESEIRQLIAESDVGVIKIIVTRGPALRGYAIPVESTSSRILIGFPATGRANIDGRVRWCDLRLSQQPKLAGIKHLNRLENVLARSEWHDAGIDEGLLMDEAGYVICGTMSNLILAEKGALITPDLSRCGVSGVARARIMRAASRHGQFIKVEAVSRERLLEADEVVLCNSLIDVWRVSEIGERRWAQGGWAEKLRLWLDEDN